MKLIDADAFDALLVDAQRRAKNNFQYGFLSSVRENLAMIPESEAYTEAKKRIENMEKIIEDQQERIDIMAADMPIHCKDCKKHGTYDCPVKDSYDGECIPYRTDDDFFCADGEPKEGENDGKDTIQTNV